MNYKEAQEIIKERCKDLFKLGLKWGNGNEKINKLLDDNINEINEYASGFDIEWKNDPYYRDDWGVDIEEFYEEESDNEKFLDLKEIL